MNGMIESSIRGTRRILLSGIPGAGKTTVGWELEKSFGLRHVDMEANRFELATAAINDIDSFVRDHADEQIVLTWGFGPFEAIEAIRGLVEIGFVPFWLDGDRGLLYSSFMERERRRTSRRRPVEVMEAAYYRQMASIVESEIIRALPWRHLNPFTPDGRRRDNLAAMIMTELSR